MKSPQFLFNYLPLLAFFALASVSILALSAPNTQAKDIEVDQAQAELARALGNYFRALQSEQKVGTDQMEAQILGPAQDRLSKVIQRKHREEQELIYDKAYHSDGTVTKASEAKELEDKPDGPSPGGAAAGTTGGGSKATKDESSRPEWVIDGSKVPKEMVFPGKAKKAAPKGLSEAP